MSKKQAIAFFEEISKNKQLAQEVEKVVEGNNSDEAKAKELISLAKKHNFNFTKEEAASAQEALKKPLSSEEMLEVSGGKLNLKSSLMAAAMLLGLGASGAALHNMEASAMKRSAPHQNNGKRGKTDQTLPGFDELISSLSNRAPQGQPTTTPQPVELTNLTQNETPPSNDQGSAQSDSGQTMGFRSSGTSSAEAHGPKPPNEKKFRASTEHDKKAAERFKAVKHCGLHHVELARRVSASGAVPAADWPAAPPADLEAENGVCRFCGKKLEALGKQELDVKCANAGCIYNWVFRPAGNKHLKGNQRGQIDRGHYARWAVLPALILDSRLITSTDVGGHRTARKLPIETPAEVWAVWQLISQRGPVVNGVGEWPAIVEMMKAHGVDKTKSDEVIRLLEESYDNLVLGNESFIDLGSEVQQLVAGHDDSWQQVRTTMEQHGYDAEPAIERLKQSYEKLSVEQCQQSGLSKEERQQMLEEKRRQKPARRQAKVTVQQVIEKLQRREELSLEEAQAIAPMLTCGKCGKTGAYAYEKGGCAYFQCTKCKKGISKKPGALLDMLQEGQANNVPVGMANAEQDEPPMQMLQELPSVDETPHHTNQMNDNNINNINNLNNLNNNNVDYDDFYREYMDFDKYSWFEYISNLDSENGDENDNPNKPNEDNSRQLQRQNQFGVQGGNQFNHMLQMNNNNNINNLNNLNDPHEDNQQLNQTMNPNEFGFYFDAQGMNPFNLGQQMMMPQNTLAMNTTVNKPHEDKERREDYENREPAVRYPGMMGYSDPQQQHFQHPNQMMNPNGFEFNFGAQGMNQFNLGQQMRMQNHDDLENTFIEPYQLQTGDPNNFTFNMGRSHAPILRRLTVYQMDGSQQPVNVQMQNTDQMNGLPQNNHFAQNQQQILQRNTNQMNDQQQNTQFDQNQQNMTYQPDVNFEPSQELQQPAAQQNPNENDFIWRFNFDGSEDFEDSSLIPGSSGTWFGPQWKK